MIELDKIYNEDCLEGMKRIPDGSVDAIICDLPYGTTACEWDTIIPFDPLWEQYNRLIKPNAPIVLFGAEPFATMTRMSNLKWYKYDWIWQKSKAAGFLNAKYAPLRDYENICVFGNEGRITYNPQGLIKQRSHNSRPALAVKKSVYGVGREHEDAEYINYPKQCLFFANPSTAGHEHPTQKPVDLLRYLIRTYSNEGDTILDNCMGSGTTAVACIREKRHFIGFELNKEYFDKACKRIDAERRQLTLF